MHYNFAKIHSTLRMLPAMAVGVSKTLWEIDDVAKRVRRPKRSLPNAEPTNRGPSVPNRQLNKDELALVKPLLDEIRGRLEVLSGGDRKLLFAYRRKVVKELGYDERSKPVARAKLKALK